MPAQARKIVTLWGGLAVEQDPAHNQLYQLVEYERHDEAVLGGDRIRPALSVAESRRIMSSRAIALLDELNEPKPTPQEDLGSDRCSTEEPPGNWWTKMTLIQRRIHDDACSCFTDGVNLILPVKIKIRWMTKFEPKPRPKPNLYLVH